MERVWNYTAPNSYILSKLINLYQKSQIINEVNILGVQSFKNCLLSVLFPPGPEFDSADKSLKDMALPCESLLCSQRGQLNKDA